MVLCIGNGGFIPQACCETDRTTQMKTVKDRLLKDYDKHLRPTNGSNTTEVNTIYSPRQIIEFDEERSLLSMDAFIFLSWHDPRLMWNASEYDESGFLQLPSSMLWVPDVSIFGSHSQRMNPTQEVLVAIGSSGHVYWFPPLLSQTSCTTISDTAYPYDELDCTIWIGSWMHDGWAIDFQNREFLYGFDFKNVNPRWELDVGKMRKERKVEYYSCCEEPYIYIKVFCPLKRRPVPEIEVTRTPCILVMILSLSIFWLPADSSMKLLLGGILFMVLNLLLAYVAHSTKAALLVLLGVSFLQTTMYLVVITNLLQVFVVIKIASFPGPSRPPAIVTQLLTGTLGKYACLRSPLSEDKLPLDRMQLKEDSSTVESMSARDEWKLFATAIDRALFVVMLIVMIAVHHL